MDQIVIKRALNGAIVEVGCQTFVFENLSTLREEVYEYLVNPLSTLRRYRKKYGENLRWSEAQPIASPVGVNDREAESMERYPVETRVGYVSN